MHDFFDGKDSAEESSNGTTIGATSSPTFQLSDAELLASSVTLPCGRVVANRFVKVAMYEHLASFFGGPPNEHHLDLYARWAQGDWGMILTGNIQISSRHLSLGRDMVIPQRTSPSNVALFKKLADAMRGHDPDGKRNLVTKGHNRTLCIVQLSHTGRQSPRLVGGRLGRFHRPVGPSSKRLGEDTREGIFTKFAYAIGFEVPHTLNEREVKDVVQDFVRAAQFVYEAGFDGIQLHAAHGYLISQFLSPNLNNRTDAYGDRVLFLQQIITGIRAAVPSTFVLGVKLNAGDYTSGGMTEDEAMDHVKHISDLSVDFIEVSGGTYENPVFGSLSPREAFFASFSRRVIKELQRSASRPIVLLTGGFRNPVQLSQAIREQHADLLGLGRLSVFCPDLPLRFSPAYFGTPKQYADSEIKFPDANLRVPGWIPKLAGAGVGTAYYTVAMRLMAKRKPLSGMLNMGSFASMFWMWIWEGPGWGRLGGIAHMALLLPLILLAGVCFLWKK